MGLKWRVFWSMHVIFGFRLRERERGLKLWFLRDLERKKGFQGVLEGNLSESSSRDHFRRRFLLQTCSTHQEGEPTLFSCLISSMIESRSDFKDQNNYFLIFVKSWWKLGFGWCLDIQSRGFWSMLCRLLHSML